MITRVYEITCDYCLAAIYHGLGSKQLVLQQMLRLSDPGILYKGHHFCDQQCLDSWLESGKKNILGEK